MTRSPCSFARPPTIPSHGWPSARCTTASRSTSRPASTAATPSGTWWRAELVAHNTVSNYRFLLDGGSTGYRWLSAAGLVEADVPDGGDFRVAVAPEPPGWLDDAIVYQVFPDRFARSGRVTEPLPDWAVPAAWDDAPKPAGRPAARQFFGGDLYGVAEHLDHIAVARGQHRST